jgi:hypothetical protein
VSGASSPSTTSPSLRYLTYKRRRTAVRFAARRARAAIEQVGSEAVKPRSVDIAYWRRCRFSVYCKRQPLSEIGTEEQRGRQGGFPRLVDDRRQCG